ncbi:MULTISPECIES: glycosyltransferase family 1 protein [unclassified Saccharibacter]|uniref:glycosyltransferase family 4 protein n=1 Tax=unclassified Saccharibacter TaxID=2648722 RepID=UPI001324CBAF|nr:MULTISPECIES: glycosyltransferase family 1 protein [unclassified Saccharibacter]MXV36055.1 glycosyltransferase [Saccharibacter sp. EH611]MXV56914.1 glycosyltransferase [Saccharibacter sp. EH70]MXV66726.1 glycosyltransferase [Saccharibacter sp. EH60]
MKKFRLSAGHYYLFFGQLEPKKNIGRLLEAFLASPAKRPLVLVGSHGWKQDEELRLLPKALESGRVVHIPYLPEEELLALIRQTRAVLFPSIAEGFGLPVFEAFSQGTAVLTSKRGALGEVAGDAALLVEPYDVSSIRDGIMILDQDDALCSRLQKRGLERCEYFNIERYQGRLRHFYHDVLS